MFRVLVTDNVLLKSSLRINTSSLVKCCQSECLVTYYWLPLLCLFVTEILNNLKDPVSWVVPESEYFHLLSSCFSRLFHWSHADGIQYFYIIQGPNGNSRRVNWNFMLFTGPAESLQAEETKFLRPLPDASRIKSMPALGRFTLGFVPEYCSTALRSAALKTYLKYYSELYWKKMQLHQ